ncbi:peroxiredoxin family protein [Singulisphaera acidiphila]|uniref:Peroxiredoxin n=1 Tax=Singulisphaera acidiphila (strain ATCC BAA-1392 / DSM 18658 / VKM B-2454 / MOB10) TaxID=886293 RepID=L0DK68_SINAD|nr:peroxiredoxin family protein [Singulisphaera acidiphila]AGA29652.1 Peroxiredoxin [Singulisphaera acidiphila DSM 18658]
MRLLLRAQALPTVLALVLASQAGAQEPTKPTESASEKNPAIPAAGHSIHGEAFNDGPRHQAHMMDGMGKIHFPVTTAKPEVQAFIDQGVAQLHSFYYYESERSFRQAARLDPDCAMAYWGMAMSNVNNDRRAKGFVKEARKRAAKISKRETLYLDALEALYQEGGDSKARKKNHLLGLETIVQEFPGDIDARAWLAMVTWQNASSDGIGSRQAVDTLLDTVFQVEPMHPGAHHYRIHLWDGVKPARAEKSAGLFARTAPGIAHAWHMPGHTYTGLKRYTDAAYQQEGSARVDHASMFRERTMPFEIHNYAHNNQWLATSLSHIGRAREAITVARNLVEQPRDPSKNGKNDGGSPQRSGRARWAEILCRYELWDDLIAATDSGALDWSDVNVERKEKAYTLGLAYAATGNAAKLTEQIDALKALIAGESKSTTRPSGSAAPSLTPSQLALAELEGYQLLAKGDVGPAFDQFAKASPMRTEALARAHLTARNFGFAESVAKTAVEKQPNEVPPLAAQVVILHAVGKDKEAKEAYRKLEPLAKQADRDLPVFQRLEQIVAGWKADDKDWAPAVPVESATDDATANRIDLSTLGPLTWAPYPAELFSRPDTEKADWNLADQKGKNVVLLLFLGGKCAHCMQQLQTFGKEIDALKALNTEVVAVSTDDLESTRELKNNPDKIKFSMPMLSDAKMEIFKAYHAFDDFEDQPLHGTFLIDAKGMVRFQRISADPFLDTDFIKTETARVNRLLKNP